MKNKPTRHKESNTFKFQPFSERIANINIDIFHRVGHENELQTEEDRCQFYQAIEKWDVLNLTEYYGAFRKEINPNNLITLPQLIHNKDDVVRVLLKHLRFKNVLCLQALLELVVALANDLRKDFYIYYGDFLTVLIDLLNTKESEQLEWTFTCLAYLFKFLWRPLTKDVNVVFNSLLPLLSDTKPDYINNFAAESFAFVVRKIKDLECFLNLILKSVKRNDDGVVGCGRLLFEVLHGVNGQFHSCAESMLPFLLESLTNNKLSQNLLFEILEEVVKCIALNIYPQKCQLFWSSCITLLEQQSQKWNPQLETEVSKNLEMILKLIGQGLEYKNGKLLQLPVPLVRALLKLLDISNLRDDVFLVLSQVAVLLLLSKHVNLPQEYASILTRKMLCVPNQVLLHFVDHIADYSSFEALVLPEFLKKCIENNLCNEYLYALTRLVLKKSPSSYNGINLETWTKYDLNFNFKTGNDNIYDNLIKYLQLQNVDSLISTNLYEYLCTLICIPHLSIEASKVDALKDILKANIKMLSEDCKTKSVDDGLKMSLFFLLNVIESSIHILPITDLIGYLDLIMETILPLSNNVETISALKILDLYLSALKMENEIINKDIFKKLHSRLETNFNSPYHEVRLLTSHIYTLFEPLLKSENPEWKVFSICYEVESTIPQVQTYRDQIRRLELLTFDKQQMSLCKVTDFKMIPLRYLCGALYMNFQLLWEPTISIIESHARGLDTLDFWNVYVMELNGVNENIKQATDVNSGGLTFDLPFLQDLYNQAYKIEVEPDFLNYRLLLWKGMKCFPEIAEAKTRDTSELLLKFMEDEYFKSNSDVAATWNIKQNSTEAEATVVSEEQDDLQVIKRELRKPAIKTKGGMNLKTLQHYLTIFSKVRSPKSMYREPELYNLYFELLSHKNHDVQKLALDCIMTYKFKHLTPYQEHLYNLVNENNFKDELATFRVDTESSIVKDEHRKDLIPIVLKILYSKMFAKTGLRTGGKSSGQLRRNLVLRFLAGCQENEMLSFIRMAFNYYLRFFKDNLDLEELMDDVTKSVSLEKFIPPKRLQSSLNLLTVVFEQFGGLMGSDLLGFLVKVLLIIGSSIRGAFEQIGNVHSGYSAILRNLRTSSIRIVERFFEHFDSYPWEAKEINAIFNTFIWPYIDKLNVEGIHSPTNMLKLFIQFGSHPKYFPLLMKHHPENKDCHILPYVIKLLLNKQSHPSVINAIMEMFEKLLSLIPHEDEPELKIPIDHLIPLQDNILERLKLNDNLNYGSSILLPHASSILQVIKRKLENKLRGINRQELFILSRLSELVWESKISDDVLRLLFPVTLKKSSSGEELVLKYVTSIANLINNVDEPQIHFKQLCPLFGDVSYVSSRKILCNILETISKSSGDANLQMMAEIVLQLNAWDVKWVDQPDYSKRLDGFKSIKRCIENDSMDVTVGVILIHNCFYIINNENDLSLKENAADCWKNVSSALLKKYENSHKELDYILNDVLFNMIRRGLKNRNDEARNECILLLGHLARENPTAHIVLQDLHKLTNKIDVEVDVFQNITHLQVHRHARALLKFCQVFKQVENAPSSRTLTQFILPLATFYLCKERYAQKNSLVDAAIEVVATVTKLLPWHQYEGVLKFYLGKLRHKTEYQKQLVRLMVVVLDAFHFDLSKGIVCAPGTKGDKMEQTENNDEMNKSEHKNGEIQSELETRPEDEMVEVIDEKLEEEDNIEDEMVEVINEKLEEEDNIEDEEEEEDNTVAMKAIDKVRVLCQSTATRVITTIQVVLLPQLHKTLAQMTHHDSSHKVNRKKTGFEREEEDLSKVPISLAVVKLLQRLPKQVMEANLPGIFMKLCTFLRSQLESVRRVTRETLQKIMLTLGPEYLGLLLEEMSPLLSRGFQVHVLVYTVHSVLVCLKEMYRPNDIDRILLSVLGLCKIDLFGAAAEEKEIEKIGRKVSEAKSTKSFNTLQILSQYITDKCLIDIVLPIKTVLMTSHSFKMISKAQESLRHIAMGLVENSFIPIESLLKFAYGTSSESIPKLLTTDGSQDNKASDKDKMKFLGKPKSDTFIIPAAPVGKSGFRRTGVKSSSKANAHIIVEFGLRLCHYLFKKEKIKDHKYKPFLDPFVVIFKNCLQSQYVKLSTMTLQCLIRMMKYDLPSMRQHIGAIAEMMFAILHKYGAAGLSKGDNFELVVAAFKAMAVLVRDVKYHTIDTDQLKILLLYVEQDLHNYERQATAFALLRAIISRKLMTPEIHSVMNKIAELSITSEMTHIRLQSRVVFHQFLMDYPLKGRVDRHVSFYLTQLQYELQSGRESAIEMIQTLINTFPIDVLVKQKETYLIALGARLINEDVPECRKMIADCLTAMFKRLPQPEIDPLFDIILLWFKDAKGTHAQLAAQLCGLLVMVEKSLFETRLPKLLPVILMQLRIQNGPDKPGRFVLLPEENQGDDKIKDHQIFQLLQMILKICAHCPSFLKDAENVQELSEHVQVLLGHPHEWVRLVAAQFLGFVLSSLDIDKLANLLVTNQVEESGYLYANPSNGIKTLTLDLCDQLQPDNIKSDLAEQVIKNLVFIARVLQNVPPSSKTTIKTVDLLWLTKRLRKICNMEVVENPSSMVLRMEVFKWVAGVGTALDVENVIPVLRNLLAPLVREMITTEESNAPLRQLSKEVGTMLKKRIGIELYTKTISELQQRLSVKRAERKRGRTQLAITNPEMFAKKKIKMHEKKKEAKKRKLGQRKGKIYKAKKRKVVDLDDNSEVM